ncbi:MAG: hypothetical protein M3041_20395, partial [Acidobacteriota bacterium]|nr:hypothetical protein [Acidobacteriota bacterium]
GVRLQRIYAATHPAAILLYLRPESPLAAPANRERLVGILRLAGHRPQVVSTSNELRGAVATGEFDLLLTEPADMALVREATKAAKAEPAIVQLYWEPSSQDLERLDQRDECAARVSRRSHELLIVVNDVMDQRHKGLAVSCRRSRT